MFGPIIKIITKKMRSHYFLLNLSGSLFVFPDVAEKIFYLL